ncbi:hypothetical protein RF11_15355 [Thelohanellus kitauei]|uniref:Transposase Tc1-like domain-containing protein n=1 Tax=Thelohanellus kitauei TaxID=669202 RepID=A0A0C2IU07_THEKT|nr:hypothetical protein RF11_15355 [Thelohanellus kitauei]
MKDKISSDVRRRRKYAKISLDMKQKVVDYIEQNPQLPIAEVARHFSLNERTLRKIYSRYQRDGRIVEKIRGGARNNKVKQIHKDRICLYLEKDPNIPLRQVVQNLNNEFKFQISQKTVSRVIKSLNITYALIRPIPISRNNPEDIQARFLYAQKYFER